MTSNSNPTTTIEAVAAVIHAAGFHTMAREYVSRPTDRAAIVRAMTKNIRNDRTLGPDMANNFARLARQVEG